MVEYLSQFAIAYVQWAASFSIMMKSPETQPLPQAQTAVLEPGLTLVVLAAGMGSRYGGLKQMDAIGPNGERMLDFSVDDAARGGFDKIVFVIRRDFADAFKREIVAPLDGVIDTAVCYQDLADLPGDFTPPEGREKPWGTAHAVYAARHVVEGPFAVINADDYYGREAFAIMARALRNEAGAAINLVVYTLAQTLSEHGGVNRGVCSVREGYLKQIAEHIDIRHDESGVLRGTNPQGARVQLDPETPVSMNFWGFGSDFMEVIESALLRFLEAECETPKSECYLPAVVNQYLHVSAERCAVLPTCEPWFGVTYPEDKPAVKAATARLLAKRGSNDG